MAQSQTHHVSANTLRALIVAIAISLAGTALPVPAEAATTGAGPTTSTGTTSCRFVTRCYIRPGGSRVCKRVRVCVRV